MIGLQGVLFFKSLAIFIASYISGCWSYCADYLIFEKEQSIIIICLILRENPPLDYTEVLLTVRSSKYFGNVTYPFVAHLF